MNFTGWVKIIDSRTKTERKPSSEAALITSCDQKSVSARLSLHCECTSSWWNPEAGETHPHDAQCMQLEIHEHEKSDASAPDCITESLQSQMRMSTSRDRDTSSHDENKSSISVHIDTS